MEYRGKFSFRKCITGMNIDTAYINKKTRIIRKGESLFVEHAAFYVCKRPFFSIESVFACDMNFQEHFRICVLCH